MPYFKTITVRMGPRFLPAGALFAFLVLIICILVIMVLGNLPDSSFWKSDNGTVAAVGIIVVFSSFTILPALLLWFSEGRLTIDSFGMSWKMKKEKGGIVWKKPFTVKRWQSVITVPTGGSGGDTSPPSSMDLPAIIYDISQENTRVARRDSSARLARRDSRLARFARLDSARLAAVSARRARLALYRFAGFDEVKGLPDSELYGIMLNRRAKKITDIIDQMSNG